MFTMGWIFEPDCLKSGSRGGRDQQAKVSSMRALSAKATAICKNTGDYKWKKQVQKVADAIRYADPVSRGDTRQTEQQIDEALEQIRIAVRTENQKEFDEAAERIRRSLDSTSYCK